MSTERPYHFDHLLQVLKKSLSSLILYIFFNVFMHVYSPRPGTDNPLVTKFWRQQKAQITLTICSSFKMISLNSVLYTFFNVFPHAYSPETGADNPLWSKSWCQKKGFVTLPICCKFQKTIFEVWFYTYFCLFLYMYIAPEQGRTTPIYININLLSLWSFAVSFVH